jgi:hypothetical protein
MSALLRRILFVGLALILSFEIVCQLEVHWNWRESAGELAQLLVYGFLLLGVIWAVLPASSSHDSRLLRGLERSVIAVGLVIALHTTIYIYSWHVRPNVGLYQEPDWVSQHPQFQEELRERIESNKWW